MSDLDSIKAIYFQECSELLAELEQGLMDLEAGEGDAETINAVFRAVHSVKGGGGAFGFDAMVEFAHVFETVLDLLRSDKIEASEDLIRLMLRASDILVDFVQAAKGEGSVDEARAKEIREALDQVANGSEVPAAAAVVEAAPEIAVEPEPVEAESDEMAELDFAPVQFDFDDVGPGEEAAVSGDDWTLTMRPSSDMYAKGHDAFIFLRELQALGEVEVEFDDTALPGLEEIEPEISYLTWTVRISGNVAEDSIREIFDFVGDECVIELSRDVASTDAAEPEADLAEAVAPTVEPEPVEAVPEPAPVEPVETKVEAPVAEPPPAASKPEPAKPASEPAAAKKAPVVVSPTIRVDLNRVDRMIDLVGELVINQAMLAQRVSDSEMARSSDVAIGLDELEQLTREIQDSVMAIRAQPVKSVFQRMPRLVREIAGTTGKDVRLTMEGEGTEVDKTVIERLADPITHMLRNAIDHGLESPDKREAAGKPREGQVRLAALHRSGRIVIEVSDDGAGINRERVRSIAVEKGLIAEDATLTDEETDNLIFLPGFSTAQEVSNISGRGVGMDVVKKSIQALGGRISISSNPGKGSVFTMSLPLTLAVLDGMVLGVGDHTLVAPLTAIVETLQPKPNEVRHLGAKGAVLAVRGAYVPLIDVGIALGWREEPIDPIDGVVLLVESEVGGRAALVVDAIQGQRQVVIKSLEANYGHVDAIAAATILGDGRVALILDVDFILESRDLDIQEPVPLAKAS